MPRNSPTGFVCAFFATVMGFALIWHIWWMVILGLIGAFATFVVFAWRDHDEYEIPADEVARIDRANRAARARSRHVRQGACTMIDRGRPSDDPHHLGVLAQVEHEGPASKRIVTGYGFWIFLLSDIVMFSCFFATYAVLLGQTAGGPSGAQLFDLRSVAVETGVPAAVELHLRHGEHRRRGAQPALVPGRDGRDLHPRPRLPLARVPRIRRPGRARRRPVAQRLPVGVLHAGRMPRRPRLGRHPVAARP